MALTKTNTPPSQSPVYMYILMRTDLASMNPGKAVAQGAHAANQCVEDGPHPDLLKEWQAQSGKGFGTTITLGVDEREMRRRVSIAKAMHLHAEIVHDPSYPLLDGKCLHLIPLDTCAYVFGRKSDVEIALRDLDLMP